MSASYPGSVKVFASRSNGQTIDASHVGDLQDEVNAIESGLLNGTANLNSSNSTLVNLSVTGNSTFAGNVTVSGSISLGTGAQTGNGQPRVRAYNASTQTISSGSVDTVLTFSTTEFNVGTVYANANPTRLTVQSTGVWLFGATMRSQFINTVGGTLRFRKNGATAVGTQVGFGVCPTAPQYFTHSVIEAMTSTGDYMEVLATQGNSAVAESGNASSRVDQNQFWAVKLW